MLQSTFTTRNDQNIPYMLYGGFEPCGRWGHSRGIWTGVRFPHTCDATEHSVESGATEHRLATFWQDCAMMLETMCSTSSVRAMVCYYNSSEQRMKKSRSYYIMGNSFEPPRVSVFS